MAKASILISGTSRGIGLEIVKQLCQAPDWIDKIYATARSENDALKEITSAHPHVTFVKLDVQNESSIKSAAAEVAKDLGGNRGLNYLINNAGIQCRKTIEETDADDINTVMNTNVTGPIIMTKEFLPLLQLAHTKGGEALVVNYSSALGSFGFMASGVVTAVPPTYAYVYRMSKAALDMMTNCIHMYLSGKGVKVMAVSPGWVQTDMGGPNAALKPVDSVRQTLDVIRHPLPEHFGKLVNFNGTVLPW